MATPIGTLGNIPNLVVGGRVFTDLTNLIVLAAYVTTASNRATFRKINTSAGYAVTAGKTLTIYAAKATAASSLSTTSAVTTATFAYSDNDVGLDTATAFTNPVYEIGDVNFHTINAYPAAGNMNINEVGGLNFQVLQNKFPGFVNAGAGQLYIYVYGYET